MRPTIKLLRPACRRARIRATNYRSGLARRLLWTPRGVLRPTGRLTKPASGLHCAMRRRFAGHQANMVLNKQKTMSFPLSRRSCCPADAFVRDHHSNNTHRRSDWPGSLAAPTTSAAFSSWNKLAAARPRPSGAIGRPDLGSLIKS